METYHQRPWKLASSVPPMIFTCHDPAWSCHRLVLEKGEGRALDNNHTPYCHFKWISVAWRERWGDTEKRGSAGEAPAKYPGFI